LSFDLTQLDDAWNLLMSNKFSPYFLPPAKLETVLSNVAKLFPGQFKLLDANWIGHICIFYDIVKVNAALFNNNIRLFIDIPLLPHDQKYDLYKAI
jgi:hypothetical protein